MANKLFYGVSTTIATDYTKQVIIYNPLEEEISPGDLLAVYFAHGNTAKADENNQPTLLVYGTSNVDSNDEQINTSESEGILIKTCDVEADLDYMWRSGEVCLFTLTSRNFNTNIEIGENATTQNAENDALYYMLIRGTRADNTWYGLTKLFTDEFPCTGDGITFSKFDDWLSEPDLEVDKTTAATPYLVKQLAAYIYGNLPEPSGGGPDPSPAPTISYEDQVPGAGTVIGVLKIGDNEISVRIPESAASGGEKTYTHEFINDADIGVNQSQEPIHVRKSNNSGTYFITNILDDGHFYLYKEPNTSVGIYAAVPNQNGTLTDPVKGKLEVKSLLARWGNSSTYPNGITVLNYSYPEQNLYMYGKPITLVVPKSSGGNATVSVQESGFVASMPVRSPEFIENGISLHDKYSGKLTIKLFRIGMGDLKDGNTGGSFCYYDGGWKVGRKTNIRGGGTRSEAIYCPAKSTCGHRSVLVSAGLSGYMPLGIVGYNISWATGDSKTIGSFLPKGKDTDSTYQMLWELYLTGRKNGEVRVHYDTRNLNTTESTLFIIDVYILCEKIV